MDLLDNHTFWESFFQEVHREAGEPLRQIAQTKQIPLQYGNALTEKSNYCGASFLRKMVVAGQKRKRQLSKMENKLLGRRHGTITLSKHPDETTDSGSFLLISLPQCKRGFFNLFSIFFGIS